MHVQAFVSIFNSDEVTHSTAVFQVYLGGWGTEVAAGTAYDLGALFFWGTAANLNVCSCADYATAKLCAVSIPLTKADHLLYSLLQFPLERYGNDLPALKQINQDNLIAMLKRYSTGFSRCCIVSAVWCSAGEVVDGKVQGSGADRLSWALTAGASPASGGSPSTTSRASSRPVLAACMATSISTW